MRQSQVGIVYSSRYLDHKTGSGHPESPTRLEAIIRSLNKSGVLNSDKYSLVDPVYAEIEIVKSVHDEDYLTSVRKICECGGGLLDIGDTVASSESFDVALLAAGGVMRAIELVMNGSIKNAFAIVRPPGHHAGRGYAMGFCILNNVAIGASYLLREFNVNRILIFDFDAHHGNGTQEIFYDKREVLYLSLHQNPALFPKTGYVDEVGVGDGEGYTVNVPLPFRTDDEIYLLALREVVEPIVLQYKPEVILASAGFDGYYMDPVAALSLTSRSYLRIINLLLSLSSNLCDGRLILALEGGYNLDFLGRMVTTFIIRMAGEKCYMKDGRVRSPRRILEKGINVIENVKRELSPYWKL